MSHVATDSSTVICPQCGAPVTLPGYADLAVCPFCGSGLRRVQARAADQWTPLGPGGQAALPREDEQVLHSLSCPQCAGPLCVRAGRRILLCDHCGVRVLAHGDKGVSRWLFPQNAGRADALSAAARWLAEYPGVARQARRIPLRQAQLVHIPIWEHKALVAGWEFGTKLRTKIEAVEDDAGNTFLGLNMAEERFEDPHLHERRFFQAGCDLPGLGATRPRFSGRELVLPLVAGEVDPTSKVLDPTGSATDIAERGRRAALLPTSGAADPYNWTQILRERVTLLYYPLWLVDYRAAGATHRVVVDAHDGSINSAIAPAGDGRSSPELLLRVAALLVVAVAGVWVAAVWPSGRVPSLLLAAIVFVAAVLLVVRAPSGGKVEYHDPFSS